MKYHKLKSKSDNVDQLREELLKEKQRRIEVEEQFRTIDGKYKRLEVELIRYRDHFEALVASRTGELMAINEKLVGENKERKIAERERRSFENQLQEATLLLEAMLDAIPDIIGVQDTRRGIIRFNKAGYEFFKMSEEEVVGKRCYDLLDGGIPCSNCVSKKILETSLPAQTEKYIESKKLWMDIRAYPIHDMDGRVFRIVEHWRDITELKESQLSVIESEEKYRLLVENAKDAIFIYQDGSFRFSNHQALEMAKRIGMPELRKPLSEYIHPNDRDYPDRLQNRLSGLDKKPHAMVFRVKSKEGDTIWLELNTVNLTWQQKPATLNFVRDITRDKGLERRVQDAQRMESLGTLAGGIAHDFNNLLMGIQGNVSLMYLDVEDDKQFTEKLQSIENCVESGSRLTKQLLGFARGGKYVVKPSDMNKILENSADMFGRTRKSVTIQCNYEEQLWTVMVDANQIEQVLVNLFVNAWQAMQKGGNLYLTSENVWLDEVFVRPHEVPPGRYVKISVADTGKGMDESTKRRIFEPFFTTRELGMGTGLGLASAFGIIKNHHGIITVKSRLGKGSTFCIYLPATDQAPELEKISSESIEMGSETILLVDDEPYIIDVAKMMLKGLGYTIITTSSGVDAVDIYKKKKESIDLVVLDLVMPDLGGESIFNMIRKINPKIKVLFASGHYMSDQTRALLQTSSSDFLQKPFNLRQLSTKIRCILDE
ncbi:MAG: PAS domain S-box protein [Desulfobacteraceae bacterium]|jgi:PAS domain S-box-containing protein